MAESDDRVVGSDRVLAVLLELAKHPAGITLVDLAATLNGSKPTIHRALASLRRAGLADQPRRGLYVLGDEFIRLALANQAARPEAARIEPVLSRLAEEFGETAHYAVLSGHDVVYRAKVDPAQGAVRLTSTIGGRNPAYCTAVGKLLLSYRVSTPAELSDWLDGMALQAKTPSTITSPARLLAELTAIRAQGYAVDDQENELGVNCIALPLFSGSSTPVGAVSVSGLVFRCPLPHLVSSAPRIRAVIADELGPSSVGELRRRPPSPTR